MRFTGRLLRGRVYRTYDGGGQVTTPAFDFKGLPTASELKLPLDPTAKNDWTAIASHTTIAAMATAAAPLLETTVYTSSSTHDALGRVLTAISPDGSEVAYSYNQRGALKTVDCKHRGSLTSTPVVAHIDYDVRGRRESITYAANATTTTYSYDPLSFRLRSIQTTRSSDNKKLQGLHYHYDPVGNITDIRDDAQQTVYFQNAVVEAANSYTYDPLYRLVEATGREHASQGTTQRSASQLPPDSSPLPMANDPNALRRYTQSYTYDGVGNLETVVHAPASGTGWTRRYQYRTDGNRLVATSAPGDAAGPLYTNTPTYSHTYPHDVHGNFSSMPHMPAMDWDELDQLHHCTVGSQDVYFQYAGGQRTRKYVDHAGGTTEGRIYLGSFELYRKRVNGTLKEEWESLHISDDTGRIVLVETHTVDDGTVVQSPTGIWRFQLSNHLGSAATEVTETGAVISYEEYHPCGTSAYRLVDSQLDVPTKRYRYTGMERDDETGLGYHTARYYAPWLGRWTAADPIGIGDGVNRWSYVSNRPAVLRDPSGRLGEPTTQEIIEQTIKEGEDKNWSQAKFSEVLEQRVKDATLDEVPIPKRGKTEGNAGGNSLPEASAVGPEFNEIIEIEAPETTGEGDASEPGPGTASEPQSSQAEQAAALLGVLTGEELDTTSGETRTGLEGGLAEPGTEVSPWLVLGALLTREALADLALGGFGFAGRLLRKVKLNKLADRLDKIGRKVEDWRDRGAGASAATGEGVTGDPGVILAKGRAAQAGDLSAAAELRAAKLLRSEGQQVHVVAATAEARTADFLVDGVAIDVKRIAGLGRNAAKDLAKGVGQVGPGGQVLVVRPASARQTLAQYRDFVSGFTPKQPGVTFRVVDEAALPPLNFGSR